MMPSRDPCPQVTADLAIVGGGSVAISFLYQFLLSLEHLPARRPLSVHLYEPQVQPGPGDAYQQDLSSNLLNIPAGNMSARADQRQDFVAWLHEQDPAWLLTYGVDTIDSGGFLPRPLFGAYLRAVYGRVCALAPSLGIVLTHVPSRVSRVAPLADGRVRVEPEDGPACTAHFAVLCNGNLPSQAFAELQGKPGYFNSPYPVSELARDIDPDASVCVVGTSLSAVDAVAALQQQGHRGTILCTSRNGRLPSVRSPHNTPPSTLQQLSRDGALRLAADHGGALSVAVIAQALQAEVHALGGSLDAEDVLGLPGEAGLALNAEIRRSTQAARPWQAVAAATNAAVDRIWHLMPDTERTLFHSTWRSLWMARRATFPMRNALTLQALLQTGQLSVLAGYQGSQYDASSAEFHTRLRTEKGEVLQRSRYLINATSFSVDTKRTADPLVANLLREGYAQADPFGGLALDYDTGCLKNASGTLQPQVSLLGSLAGGTYFWTTSMDVNARLALDQARRIATALCRATDDSAIGSETRADNPSPARWTAHTPPHPAPIAAS